MPEYRAIIMNCGKAYWEPVDALVRSGEMLGFEVSVQSDVNTQDVLVRWVDTGKNPERGIQLPLVPERDVIPRIGLFGKRETIHD